jgi:tetratricopeptide (TPR) repeat protein
MEGIVQHFPKAYDIGDILRRLGAAQANLGQQYQQYDMHERSEQFFALALANMRKSLEVDNVPLGHIILAELLMVRDQDEEALAELQLAKSLTSDRDEEAQIESDIANIAMLQEKYDDAIAHMKRVAEINPNYKGIWLNIGLAYRRKQNYDEAVAYYQRALEQQPDDIAVYAELGALYIATHQLKEALEAVETGLRYHPNSAHLRALLAAIYIDKGDRRQAQAALAEAERINPDLEIVQAVREILSKKRK